MNRLMDSFLELNTGHKIPTVGLGTWQITGDVARKTIETALKLGYRHIDTSHAYGNEKDIGDAIAASGLKRDQIFVVSKLENNYHDNPEAGLSKTLADLKLDYIDLYLIHWPVTFKNDNGVILYEDGKPVLKEFEVEKVWKKMECLVDSGKTKAIGVCNFGITNLKKVLGCCRIRPAVEQIEFHPYFQQKEIVDFCIKNDIRVVAYSPLGSYKENGPILKNDPLFAEIAKKLNCTTSQVILSWIRSKNICVIPRSKSESHLKENLEFIPLESSDIEKINNIEISVRYIDHPDFGPYRFL
ncbi:Aldose reductase [Dictyocoela roeselum]|nr:Aldose reductase [Dictyocoela roeselum]